MYYLSILTICLTFFSVILSHRLYRQQHTNGQTFSNDFNYNGQQNNGQRYGNQLSFPNYNRRPNNVYGSGQSGGVYQNRGPVSSSSNLDSEPSENNEEWHTASSGQESTTAQEGYTTEEPERTEPTKENNDNNRESEPKNNHKLQAIAVLRGKAKGILYFEQIGEKVQVTGSIEGLSNGLHAFHVHAFGDLSRSCESSGDHYNPYNTKHGSPFDSVRHVGDLGNVFADESGVAKINIKDTILSLKDGKNSILGHTIIVHESVDDLGRGGHVKSGRRVGCGIIGWRNDLA